MDIKDVKKIKIGGIVYSIKDEMARDAINAVKIPAGTSKKPVYFNSDGIPTPVSYTLSAACAKGVATAVASGNSNLVTSGAVYTALADKGAYEEGTWTPTCGQGTSQIPTEITEGKYFKIGNWCYIRGTMILQSKAAVEKVGGLPKVQNHSVLHQNMGITIGHLGSGTYNAQKYHMCCAGNQNFEIQTKDTVQTSAEWMIEGWYLCV